MLMAEALQQVPHEESTASATTPDRARTCFLEGLEPLKRALIYCRETKNNEHKSWLPRGERRPQHLQGPVCSQECAH
jgi:hypothetical protein